MQFNTVIFDFGKVMIHFEPEQITAKSVSDPEAIRLITKAVFDSPFWPCLDAGTITDEDFLKQVRAELPEALWKDAEIVYRSWIRHLPEIEGMNDLVHDLKARCIRVYLLSNISHYFAEHADLYPILSEMDGCVFSGVVGMVKPNPDIFEYICQKYAIDPHAAVFVDDTAKNVATAQSLGINGYLFDGDVAKLRTYLNGLLEA